MIKNQIKDICSVYVDASWYAHTKEFFYCVIVEGEVFFNKSTKKCANNNIAEYLALQAAVRIVRKLNVFRNYKYVYIQRDSEKTTEGALRYLPKQFHDRIFITQVSRKHNPAGKYLERISVKNIMRLDQGFNEINE